MLRNYLTAALWNLVRNRLYAAINIVGLAVGFAAALLIALYVRNEFSYDTWIPGYERTFLLIQDLRAVDGGRLRDDVSSSKYASRLKADISAIESVARLADENVNLRVGDLEYNEKVYWADPEIFDVLPLPVAAGDIRGALERPDAVVLTQRVAQKYFGEGNAVGRTIEAGRSHPLTVTAVLKNLPTNTYLDTEIFISGRASFSQLAKFDNQAQTPDSFTNTYTFVRLAPGALVSAFHERLQGFVQRAIYGGEQPPPDAPTVLALPISSLHLMPGRVVAFLMTLTGSSEMLKDMSLIGALIILLAGINFINLMTARAVHRSTEVGVRKVVGAARIHLILQFLGEAFVYVAISTVAAFLIAVLFLARLNALLDDTASIATWSEPLFVAVALLACALIGLLAGAYPAFVLSAFRPATVLKAGASSHLGSSRNLRQALAGIQFAILIFLGTTVTVIYHQLRFALDAGLRFDKDQALFIETPCKGAFKEELKALPGVRAVACSSSVALEFGNAVTALTLPDKPPMRIAHANVGVGFFDLYGLFPVAGRSFTDDAEQDLKENKFGPVVVNETAVRALGFSSAQASLGQSYRFMGKDAALQTIIGVVPDFALDTVGRVLLPTVYYVDPQHFNRINVKLSGQAVPETLQAIDNLWKRDGEPRPIERAFVEQRLEAHHRQLRQQTEMVGALTVTAMIIAALGLFGLSAFTAEQRTKEIGIRKAMGASKGDILRLLLWQFAKPVLWANVVAWPAAYFIMRRWLEGFVYHIALAPWMFLAASALALVIAMFTVIGHALLIARAKPVAALRYE